MADDNLPDLSPTALGRLVAGMTAEEMEAVLGPYHRPNLYQGRSYFAWIGEGAILRAFFDGPGGMLSGAVLDVPEAQRILDLGGDRRRRMTRCTINQTWVCISCRKSYRRPQSGMALACPICHGSFERIPPPGIRVPPPKSIKAWDEFWAKYKAEKSLLDAYESGELREKVKLELFNIQLNPPRRRTKRYD
jgi:hypothetical protein